MTATQRVMEERLRTQHVTGALTGQLPGSWGSSLQKSVLLGIRRHKPRKRSSWSRNLRVQRGVKNGVKGCPKRQAIVPEMIVVMYFPRLIDGIGLIKEAASGLGKLGCLYFGSMANVGWTISLSFPGSSAEKKRALDEMESRKDKRQQTT
jgi:hypothetical protein